MSKEITKRTKIEIAKSPAGLEGPGFFATKAEDVIGLARANSLWPLPFATSCCGIEFMATAAAGYDSSSFWYGAIKFLSSSSRFINGDGNYCKKNGTYFTSSI
jgi:NADH-quinone oxidoreductase subunit B